MKISYNEAIEAIKQVHLIAHEHPDGADWLECPFCTATKSVIKGHGYNETWYPHHPLIHYLDCILLKVWKQEEKPKNLDEYQTYHPNSKQVYFGTYWEDYCPGCGEKAVSGCRCPVNSRTCKNGHEWYRDRMTGHAIAGNGHSK